MPGHDDRPRIIVDTVAGPDMAVGQCDACPAATEITRPIQSINFSETDRFILLPLQMVHLDREYSVVLAPHLNRNPVVLNRGAWALIRRFRVARCLDEIPPKWIEMWGAEFLHETLLQMVELGLLVPEEVVHSSSN